MWFNPIMIWLLKSPLHGMISKSVMLVSITGRKSGKTISTPTNYLRNKDTLWVISLRDRRWWRNLRGGARVRVLLAGRNLEGNGQVIEDEKSIANGLFDYYRQVPKVAKYVNIKMETEGLPVSADCERAAHRLVMIRIDLA